MSYFGTIIPTTVQLGDVRFTGTFVDDGDRIEGLAGEAVLDTRSLDPLVQTVLGGATICQTLGIFGAACHPCPDGPTKCVRLVFEGVDATWDPTASITDP